MRSYTTTDEIIERTLQLLEERRALESLDEIDRKKLARRARNFLAGTALAASIPASNNLYTDTDSEIRNDRSEYVTQAPQFSERETYVKDGWKDVHTDFPSNITGRISLQDFYESLPMSRRLTLKITGSPADQKNLKDMYLDTLYPVDPAIKNLLASKRRDDFPMSWRTSIGSHLEKTYGSTGRAKQALKTWMARQKMQEQTLSRIVSMNPADFTIPVNVHISMKKLGATTLDVKDIEIQ